MLLKENSVVSKIISGGQTGVDRAALDFALERGIPVGGWCPLGRRAEDGRIPDHYPLKETPTDVYPQRTGWNVRDADATLIFFRDQLSGGTLLTYQLTLKRRMKRRTVNLNGNSQPKSVWAWLERHRVQTLNIAGPRESENPGIYEQAFNYLNRLAEEAARQPHLPDLGN